MIITDGDERLLVDREEAGTLELKLNVTSKGHEWKLIGDALFALKTESRDATSRLVVMKEQLAFLKVLQSRKDWASCKDL